MRLPLPEAALLGATVLWGLSFVIVKWALRDTGFVSLTALRMTLGAGVLGLVAGAGLRRASRFEWRAGVLAGLCLAGGYLLQTAGLASAGAGDAGFLTAGYIALVPVLDGLSRRRLPPLADLGPVVVALVGIALLVVDAELRIGFGEVLVAVSAVCWAAQIVVVGRVAARVASRRMAAIQAMTIAVVALACLPVAGESLPTFTPRLALCIGYLGLVSCATAYTLQIWGQRRVAPTRAATLFAGEPAFAAIFGALLLGERFDLRGWAGAGLVALAVILTLRRSQSSASSASETELMQ